MPTHSQKRTTTNDNTPARHEHDDAEGVVADGPEDDSHYCGWCGQIRSIDAALPFCLECLADRVPAELLWKIADTALSLLQERSRRVLVAINGVHPRP